MQNAQSNWILAIHDWLRDGGPREVEPIAALGTASDAEVETLLDLLVAAPEDWMSSPERARALMRGLVQRALQRRPVAPRSERSEGGLGDEDVIEAGEPPIAAETVAALAERVVDWDAQSAGYLLQLLALRTDDEALTCLASTLTESPPGDWQAVALALGPLWRGDGPTLHAFFSALPPSFPPPTTLAVLLDLANFSVRRGKLDEHPWAGRSEPLESLLENLAHRLRLLEEQPNKFGDSVEQVQQVLADSVALAIAVCDALGWIGDPRATPGLQQAMQLSHRRIQAEAAASLARLGDPGGRERLVGLSHDAVARARAVAYAEELGFAEAIDEQFRTPRALAESELADWLAGPSRFGIAPTRLDWVDSRTCYWPGYEEPRDCHLFRFAYEFPDDTVVNLGMVGPLTHAFQADLTALPIDDVYAAFAGWQAEHEEIFEVPIERANLAQQRALERLTRHIESHGGELLERVALALFLGEISLVALVQRDGQRWSAITNGDEIAWLPMTGGPTALTPDVALAIYRGRKLLQAFNG